MTDSPPTSAPPEQPLFTGRFALTDGYPTRASRAFLRLQLTRPGGWIPFTVLLVFVGLTLWDTVAHGVAIPTTSIVFGAVIIAVIVLSYVTRIRSLAKQLSVNARPGAVYELTLTQSLITTVTPNVSSSVLYSYYETVTAQGDFVFLKMRSARMRSILPRQLLSDEALEFLKSKITR